MSKALCHSGKGNKKGLSAVITNAVVAAITLVVLFATFNRPIAREIVTAAKRDTVPYPINPIPLKSDTHFHSSARCFHKLCPPRELDTTLGVGN